MAGFCWVMLSRKDDVEPKNYGDFLSSGHEKSMAIFDLNCFECCEKN